MKITELFEDDKKTKTKTKTKPDLSAFEKPQKDQPLANRKPDKDEDDDDDKKSSRKVTQRVASKEKTADASKNVRMTGDAARHLSNLANADLGDEEVEPDTPSTEVVKHEPKNLPKVIRSDMKAAGFLEPDWHIVANLPGNMSSQIRQLGKVLFKSLTRTKTDEITMLASLQGMGPNTDKEINAVVQYLKKEGKDLGPGEIDFSGIMPGYKADVHNFTAGGVHFMVVKDFMGKYIYSWPEHTTVGHTNQEKLK